MRRDIKFRAWDKIMKEMMDWDFMDGDHRFNEYLLGHWFENDNIVAMQYTGLHDKNGKEIYEGDIVRDEGGFDIVVRWENGRLGYVPFSIGRGERNPNDCEVIGNVFENPNLLEETK